MTTGVSLARQFSSKDAHRGILDFAGELAGRFVFADGSLSVAADVEALAGLFGDEGGFSFADVFAVAKYDHAVGDEFDLLESVRDIKNADLLACAPSATRNISASC